MYDNDMAICERIRSTANRSSSLRFQSDGSFNVYFTPYKAESTTTVKNTIEHFGIVGYIDLKFSKYCALITKVAQVSAKPLIYSVLKVDFVKVYSRPVALSLDEEEFESVRLRELERLLTVQCYFSRDLDLRFSLQQGYSQSGDFHYGVSRYHWNRFVLLELETNIHIKDYTIPLISGYVGSFKSMIGGAGVSCILISRLSSCNAGPSFWSRGIDQAGYCAIDVETELIAISETKTASYILLRGSLPLIWSQNNIGSSFIPAKNLDISDADGEESVKLFQDYFDHLSSQYGSRVDVIDMIPRTESGGFDRMSKLYHVLLADLHKPELSYYNFSMKSTASAKKAIKSMIKQVLPYHDLFLAIKNRDSVASCIRAQNGVFRVSDIDCVDETGLAQLWIAEEVIILMLNELLPKNLTLQEFQKLVEPLFNKLWVQMSDSISVYYTGSTSLCRLDMNPTLINRYSRIPYQTYVLISRFYLQFFQNYAAQDAIDIFVGRDIPGHKSIEQQLLLRRQIIHADYSYSLVMNCILIIKRFTAPRHIDSIISFFLAAIWCLVYLSAILIFGFGKEVFLRKPKRFADLSKLPDLKSGQPRGLATFLEKKNSMFHLRTQLRSKESDERPPVHSAVAF
jgi:hypothetical protein